jgi:2-keto-4-pentenoate hydratase/2-oxohepta-3-ene-1,7-dioic acid hydratase in catechol pathway
MHVSRFTTAESGEPSLGVVDDSRETVTEVESTSSSLDEALGNGTTWDTLQRAATGDPIPVDDVSLLAPVARPTNLVGVGLNYAGHAEEGGHDTPEEPIFFAKSPSSITAPDSAVVRHEGVTNLHWEGEFGFVVGQQARHVDESEAMDAVFGFVAGNDVTARDMQAADIEVANPWYRSKSMDTFTPLGPWVTPVGEGVDPDDADIETVVNGTTVQSSNTSGFIFTVPEIVSYVSRYVTLQPGDVVLTGTPAGVGEMEPGDDVSVTVEGLGTLSNTVTGP